ncbi:unnamed protein product, partial [Brassica rapa subsp. trilocularis]
MVSARLVDCSEEPEEPDMQKIPEMMFAAGEEPVGVRILTYQSSTAPQRILNALDEEEVDIIRRSSFGKLIELADKPQPYWPCLFGKVEVVTVSSVIKMLYRKTVKDRDIRIRYACLALLESVLLPT